MTRRSSAIRTSRSVSSAAERTASLSSSTDCPFSIARSSSVLRIVSGVRSSWLASATNARSCASAAWRRPSIAFNVSPRRESSSCVDGTGSRRSGSDPEMAAACRRMASTGRSAARATPRAVSVASSSAAGPPIRSRVSRPWSASSRSSTDVPTTTTRGPPGVATGAARRRKGSPPNPGNERRSRKIGVRRASLSSCGVSTGQLRRAGAALRTRPRASVTWVKLSSLSVRRPTPESDSRRRPPHRQRRELHPDPPPGGRVLSAAPPSLNRPVLTPRELSEARRTPTFASAVRSPGSGATPCASLPRL